MTTLKIRVHEGSHVDERAMRVRAAVLLDSFEGGALVRVTEGPFSGKSYLVTFKMVVP